jgi:hypothetical protein
MREMDLLLKNFYQILGGLDLEGNVSIEKFISKDPNAPNIDLAVVELAFDHFWRSIDGSSALSVPE